MRLEDEKELLFSLASGIEKWKVNPKKVPQELYDGQMMLMGKLVGNMERLPNNLADLLELLQQPFSAWELEEMLEILPGDTVFLKGDFTFSETFGDFLREYDSPNEYQLMPMKSFLRYCREKGLQPLYESIRTFVSEKKHAVMSELDLLSKVYQISDEYARKTVKNFYEKIDQPMSNYKQCPHCGWTLSNQNGNWICNSHYICSRLENFSDLENFTTSDRTYYVRLKPSIQRYVLIPGMQELKIKEKLMKYHPSLYPNIDEFDIEIATSKGQRYLDVKDVKDPFFLANLLNNFSASELDKYVRTDFYLVIPSYRFQWKKRYKKILYSRLNPLTKSVFEGKVVSDKELRDILREEK